MSLLVTARSKERLAGRSEIVVGTLTWFSDSASFVDFPSNPVGTPIAARPTVAIQDVDVGRKDTFRAAIQHRPADVIDTTVEHHSVTVAGSPGANITKGDALKIGESEHQGGRRDHLLVTTDARMTGPYRLTAGTTWVAVPRTSPSPQRAGAPLPPRKISFSRGRTFCSTRDDEVVVVGP